MRDKEDIQTSIRIPKGLLKKAKHVALDKDMSFASIVVMGLELAVKQLDK
jgi:hypothetical protein